jgi:hypothetical protein
MTWSDVPCLGCESFAPIFVIVVRGVRECSIVGKEDIHYSY